MPSFKPSADLSHVSLLMNVMHHPLHDHVFLADAWYQIVSLSNRHGGLGLAAETVQKLLDLL